MKRIYETNGYIKRIYIYIYKLQRVYETDIDMMHHGFKRSAVCTTVRHISRDTETDGRTADGKGQTNAQAAARIAAIDGDADQRGADQLGAIGCGAIEHENTPPPGAEQACACFAFSGQ